MTLLIIYFSYNLIITSYLCGWSAANKEPLAPIHIAISIVAGLPLALGLMFKR